MTGYQAGWAESKYSGMHFLSLSSLTYVHAGIKASRLARKSNGPQLYGQTMYVSLLKTYSMI